MAKIQRHFSEVYEGVEAGGAVRIDLPQVDPGESWDIERLTLAWDSATGGTVSIYLGEANNRNLLDASTINAAGSLVGEYDPPLRIPGGTFVRIIFGTASAGARGSVRLQRSVSVEDISLRGGRVGKPRRVRSIAGS